MISQKEKARELVDKFDGNKTHTLVCVDEEIKLLKELDEKWHKSEDAILTSFFIYEIEDLKEFRLEIKNYDK